MTSTGQHSYTPGHFLRLINPRNINIKLLLPNETDGYLKNDRSLIDIYRFCFEAAV